MDLITFPPEVATIYHPLSGATLMRGYEIQTSNVLGVWQEFQMDKPEITHPMLGAWWLEKQPLILEDPEQAFDMLYEFLQEADRAAPEIQCQMIRKYLEQTATTDEDYRLTELRNLLSELDQYLTPAPTKFPLGVKFLGDAFAILLGPDDDRKIVVVLW